MPRRNKKPRLLQEPGPPAPAQLQPQPIDQAEAMSARAGVVEEKGSDLSPIQAVVLGRFLDQESKGVVLVQADEIEEYKEHYKDKDITKAGHLAKAAKARAEKS